MMTDKESIFFLKQLAQLLGAGVPLIKSLEIMKKQKLIESLQSGESFSQSLAKNGQLKDFISSFTIAERDGMLEEALLRAACQMEKKQNFQENIKKAATYPVIILCVSILCLILMIFVVLPNFSRMFADFNCKLPAITLFIISLPNYWHSFLIVSLLFILCVYFFWRNIDFRFKIPLIGKILFNLKLGEICHNLGSQLKAGVPILESIESTLNLSGSRKIKIVLQEMFAEVKGGRALSESLKRRGIFPDFLIQMAAVGEESGSLGKMLLSASEIFESEGEQMIKRLTTYIEPAATLTVGLAVGFIALAIMMPLFSMMNSLL
jgi:type IV pilus assembly protein PilC